MTNLFEKAAIFTDIHFGLKSNSQVHNEDCLKFVKWATKTAKEQGCETCIFLGDWHNNRASINIMTLQYSLRALEHLNENFEKVYFIPGNHDLYYRDKRDVQSVEWAKHLSNIIICNDWFTEGNVTIAPWLVADDHKKIPKIKSKYVFGHFELPHFFMNAMVQMPDHGDVKREDFSKVEHVFSGHFHKRQTQGNITYIGNAFPHNYADAGDDDRGLTILEWDKPVEYISWPDQPRYRVYKLSDVLNKTDDLLKPGMHIRINIDIPISYEEANFIKETFIEQYKLREIALLPPKSVDMDEHNSDEGVQFESVDQIVINQIASIASEQFKPELLLEIYRSL